MFFRIFVVQIKSGVWNMILHQDGPVVKCYLLELLTYLVNRYENCSKKWYFVLKIVLIYCEKKLSSIEKNFCKFKAEGREFENFFRSLENNLLEQILFKLFAGSFYRSCTYIGMVERAVGTND
jgi:hypothetical protein